MGDGIKSEKVGLKVELENVKRITNQLCYLKKKALLRKNERMDFKAFACEIHAMKILKMLYRSKFGLQIWRGITDRFEL